MATATVSVGGGNWSANGTWVAGSPPASTDDVVCASTSGNLTVDGADTCQSFTVNTGYTGTVTLAAGAGINFTVGSAASASITLLAGMVALVYTSGNLVLGGTTAGATITTAGTSIPWPIVCAATGGTWTLQDNLTATATIGHTAGTLNTNGKAVSCTAYSITGATSRTLTLGATTFTLTGTGAVWTVSGSSVAITAAPSSTIAITDSSTAGKTFGGGSHSYGTLLYAAGAEGTLSMTGTNTFVSIQFPPGTGATARTMHFLINVTTTVTGSLILRGTAALPLAVASSTAATTATVACAGATVTADQLTIRDITITGSTPYPATNATLISNDTGWVIAGTNPLAGRTRVLTTPVGAQTAQTRVLATPAATISGHARVAVTPTTTLLARARLLAAAGLGQLARTRVAATATVGTPVVTVTAADGRWAARPIINPGRWTATMADPQQISHLSTDYARVQVDYTLNGVATNPTGDTVVMAFMPAADLSVTVDPAPGDWHAAIWETTPAPRYYACCLVGPANGGVVLARGRYRKLITVTDNPAIPVLDGGELDIT